MPQRPVTHLRHVDLAVPEFRTQVDFLSEAWGLTPVASDTGLAFLGAEGSAEPYVVRVRASQDKRLDLAAFGVADRATIDALAEQLAAAEVQLLGEPAPLDTPGGGYGFRCFDADGRTLEFSADVTPRSKRTLAEGESVPVGLSHVVFNSANPEATVAWYVQHLGFTVSDQLIHPHMGEMMWFLRTGPQHHTIAVARCPHHSLHHISFEMRGIDEHMRATGRLLRAGIEKVWGPGRHKAGNNTFSYFLDPHGNTLEYTTSMELVDDATWEPHVFDFTQPDVADQWGTANLMDELVARKSFNDPDRGLFVAPPV